MHNQQNNSSTEQHPVIIITKLKKYELYIYIQNSSNLEFEN